MAKYTFDTCCGCIELKTGCLIIGYLQLIGEIIATVMLLIMLLAGGVLAASNVQEQKHTTFTLNGQRFETQITNEQVHTAGALVLVISGILLLFIILALAFTITLLVGLHKDKPGHIKAYLIFGVIFLVVSILTWFGKFAAKPINVGDVIGTLLSILLNTYFLMVIRSQYFKLLDTSKGPAIYSAA